jgi:hypothetical protein
MSKGGCFLEFARKHGQVAFQLLLGRSNRPTRNGFALRCKMLGMTDTFSALAQWVAQIEEE